MSELGMKGLSLDNWLEPDAISQVFSTFSPDGSIVPATGNDWAQRILEPRLAETIPPEVRRLFEVARGSMAYGWFFYPLYTLGMVQAFRVADAAMAHRCDDLGAPSSVSTFDKRIKWLVDTSALAPEEGGYWHTIRRWRNASSHPTDQSICFPGQAIATLARLAEAIYSGVSLPTGCRQARWMSSRGAKKDVMKKGAHRGSPNGRGHPPPTFRIASIVPPGRPLSIGP